MTPASAISSAASSSSYSASSICVPVKTCGDAGAGLAQAVAAWPASRCDPRVRSAGGGGRRRVASVAGGGAATRRHRLRHAPVLRPARRRRRRLLAEEQLADVGVQPFHGGRGRVDAAGTSHGAPRRLGAAGPPRAASSEEAEHESDSRGRGARDTERRCDCRAEPVVIIVGSGALAQSVRATES